MNDTTQTAAERTDISPESVREVITALEDTNSWPARVVLAMQADRERLKEQLAARDAEIEALRKDAERPMLPDLLFDGYAVMGGLSDKARGRTSRENVSDTLDAIVKILRVPIDAAKGAGGAG